MLSSNSEVKKNVTQVELQDIRELGLQFDKVAKEYGSLEKQPPFLLLVKLV